MNNKFFLPIIFGFSGATALIYEIVWSRHFQLVFGSTIYTSSTVFAAFLAGFALGSFFTGQKLPKFKNLIRTIGYTEIFVALYALLLSVMFNYGLLDFLIVLPLVLKLILCLILLFPPAFLFGSLWPLISDVYIKNVNNISNNSGVLYFFNSIGSGLGAFVSGFLLIPWVGLIRTSYIALLINSLIGIILLLIAKRIQSHEN